MKMTFKPLTSALKPTLFEWLNSSHVQEFFYGYGLTNTLNNIDLFCDGINTNGSYSFEHWIAYLNDEPFGFLITSLIEGPYNKDDDYNRWFIEGGSTYTLDILIGPKEYLGKGLAATMIKAFILDKFQDADFFLIDPEVANPKAIHVYEKVGFKKIAQFTPDFNPKPHIMMRMAVDELK
jgi:aminoglycoside 6'-N-acetyltransferase